MKNNREGIEVFGGVGLDTLYLSLHDFLSHQIKMANGVIPVVDFGIMGLNSQNSPALDEESVQSLAREIHTAFSTIGFVYLTNHGISDAEVSISGINKAVRSQCVLNLRLMFAHRFSHAQI